MIACYTTPGGNNNSYYIITVFALDGVSFVKKNNGRQILNKCHVPVRRGEKGLLYPFSKHEQSYVSKFPLNFNFFSVCGSTTHCNKNMCPMKEETGDMNDFYCELNIHKPHTDLRNEKFDKLPLRTGKVLDSKM